LNPRGLVPIENRRTVHYLRSYAYDDSTAIEDQELHSSAAARFNELAAELMHNVRSFAPIEPPREHAHKTEIHTVATITTGDIIGEIKIQQQSVNGLGEVTGRRLWPPNLAGNDIGSRPSSAGCCCRQKLPQTIIRGAKIRKGTPTPVKGIL
jgi:hypothetical protein